MKQALKNKIGETVCGKVIAHKRNPEEAKRCDLLFSLLLCFGQQLGIELINTLHPYCNQI